MEVSQKIKSGEHFRENAFEGRKGKNITDMTVGSPTKHILVFALPLFLGNLFQQLYNMVDSLVVGNFIDGDALAAVGSCGSMNFLFFSLSSGIAIGIGVIVSQYFGAQDDVNVRRTIANSFYVVMGAAIVVSLLGYFFSPYLVKLLQVKTPATYANAVTYIRTTCLGIVGVALYNNVSAILRALGDSKTPLYFLILSSIVNVVLDLVFVICFGMGVFGVALATVISQYASALSSLIYALLKVSYFNIRREERKLCGDIIRKSIKAGIPIALQNSMIAISCMALQGVVNTFGEKVMTAYTITGRIEQLVQQPYSSLGTALTSYSGQNMGAGKIDRVKKGFRRSALMCLIFSLIMLPLFYFFGRNIADLFLRDDEVESINIAAAAIRITSPAYFGLGMIYVPRAVLNGCGDTRFAMLNGVTEFVCRILYGPLLTMIPVLGYWGIWVTSAATWITTAIVCCIRYFRGRWKTKSFVST